MVDKCILWTPQEHKLIGSTIPNKYHSKPYTPIAVYDGMPPVICQTQRRQVVKRDGFRGFCSYWNVEGYLGDMSLEDLNIDEESDAFGQTLMDPELIRINPVSSTIILPAQPFPFPRGDLRIARDYLGEPAVRVVMEKPTYRKRSA